MVWAPLYASGTQAGDNDRFACSTNYTTASLMDSHHRQGDDKQAK